MSEVAQAPHSSPDGRIPQLRFPEFDGVWESRLLKDAVKINPRSGELPDEFIYIDLESVKKGYLIKETQINKIGAPSRAQRLLNKNDVIFQTVRPYQKNNYFFNLDGDYVASTGYAQLRVLNSPEFLYQALHTDRFVYDVMARSTGTSYPAINSTDLSKIKLNLPTKPEQQKIAAFLTAVDNKIEQLSKKQELLGEYKKGLMQQIFSQEIRFKADDGSDFPDWEEKKLGNISNVSKLAGYEFTKYIKYQDTGSIIALRGLNIKKNKLDLSVVKFIDNSDFSRLNRSKLFIDDLMFTYIGTIGEVALIDEDDKYYLAPNVSRIRFNNEVCLPRFAIQYFNREVFKQGEIKKYVSSSSQPALTMGNVRLFILNLPTKPEQQKIANFLSSIDSKIEQVGEQLDKSKQFKKALLQKMFV